MSEYRDPDPDMPLLCSRCGANLTPGDGSFYWVRIEAMADPTPPSFTEEDLHRDTGKEIQQLMDRLGDLSAQEALDQVYRRLFLYLCGPCYRQWIEDPAGLSNLPSG
jgi:hypothetical protein